MTPSFKPADARLHTLTDGLGMVGTGWVGERVLYSRFAGKLHPALGAAHGSSFETLTRDVTGIAYFGDGRDLVHYDLLVRSAFARFVLSNPRRFASITLLACDAEVRRTLAPLSGILSNLVEVLSSVDDFEHRLCQAAPLALTTLAFQARHATEPAIRIDSGLREPFHHTPPMRRSSPSRQRRALSTPSIPVR